MIYVVVATYGNFETYDRNVWASTSSTSADTKLQELSEYYARQKQAKQELDKWMDECYPWPLPEDEEASRVWNEAYDQETQRLSSVYQIDIEDVNDDTPELWIDEVEDESLV